MSYKTLQNIYNQRKNHRLSQWHIFLDLVLEQLEHPNFIKDERNQKMTDNLETIKNELIKQVKEDSAVDYASVLSTLDELTERIVHYVFEFAYDKGWADCESAFNEPEPVDFPDEAL